MNELQPAATTAKPGGSGKSASTAKPNDALADHASSVANQKKLTNSLTAETEAGMTTLAKRVYKDLTIESRIDIRTRVTVSHFRDYVLQRPLQSSKQVHVPVGGQSQDNKLESKNYGDDDDEDDDDDGDTDDDDDDDDSYDDYDDDSDYD